MFGDRLSVFVRGANAAWNEAAPGTRAPGTRALLIKDGADCHFVGEPRIECSEGPVEGSARVCSLKADVRNRGNKSALHAYIICVTRHNETGELAQLTWRRIGFGLLRASGEFDAQVPYEEPGIPEEDRLYEHSVRWKNRNFPNVVAERCEIAEKTAIQYEAGEGATRVLGFIVNSGESSGFAPRLAARVTDEKGEVVRSAFARTPQLPLDPGEQLPFIITLPAIREDLLDNVTLEFER